MDDVFETAPEDANAVFLKDVLEGLAQPQKTLPCRYFYDEAGSHLFEQITELPEYYPTRTERGILSDNVDQIAAALGSNTLLVEYGAGASTKTRILLDALDDMAGYVPIDVSEAFLLQTAEQLRQDYPALRVHPIVGDFMVRFGLPANIIGAPAGFFPGSTIGNLSDADITAFMHAARALLGDTGKFLIGVDLRKSEEILVPAYDDAAGVTAAFNLNLLKRINRDLGATFDVDEFAHRAIWNDQASRIEMHLESLIDQSVRIGHEDIEFAAGETIHTENSRKFALEALLPLFQETGWRLETEWRDEQDYFAVVLLHATSA
ncbi:MAG: L-histidine N(alpha)-methyltransferase [Pseudomonadota bacterium]